MFTVKNVILVLVGIVLAVIVGLATGVVSVGDSGTGYGQTDSVGY